MTTLTPKHLLRQVRVHEDRTVDGALIQEMKSVPALDTPNSPEIGE